MIFVLHFLKNNSSLIASVQQRILDQHDPSLFLESLFIVVTKVDKQIISEIFVFASLTMNKVSNFHAFFLYKQTTYPRQYYSQELVFASKTGAAKRVYQQCGKFTLCMGLQSQPGTICLMVKVKKLNSSRTQENTSGDGNLGLNYT